MESQPNQSTMAPSTPLHIDPVLSAITDAHPDSTPDHTFLANDESPPSLDWMPVTYDNSQQTLIDGFGGHNQRQHQPGGLFHGTNHQTPLGFGAQQHQQYQPQPQQQAGSYAPGIPQNPYGSPVVGIEAQEQSATATIRQSDTQISNTGHAQQQAASFPNTPYANFGQPAQPTPIGTGRSQSQGSPNRPDVSNGRSAPTKQDKLDSHKRAEAVRRNERAQALRDLVQRVPETFKDGTRKQNSEARILTSATQYLADLRLRTHNARMLNQKLRTELINGRAHR